MRVLRLCGKIDSYFYLHLKNRVLCKVHNMMGEQLADGLGSKSYSKWGDIRLVASH